MVKYKVGGAACASTGEIVKMKSVAKLTSALAFAALCAAFSTGSVAKAETMKEKNPAPKAGEQILMTAELPLATGGTWTGGDAMPLGGPNPIDETKTETLKSATA